jgi:hypothetical protein
MANAAILGRSWRIRKDPSMLKRNLDVEAGMELK